MNPGTAQGQRFPPPPPNLAAGQFGVDETPLHHLVAMTAGLADRLRLVDPGHPDSDTGWAALFDGDPSLVLARIASFDRAGLQAQFLQLWPSAPVPRLAVATGGLVARIDDWYRALARVRGDAAAAVALREHIEDVLRPELKSRLTWLRRRYAAELAGTTGAAVPAPLSGGLDERLWSVAAPPAEVARGAERAAVRSSYFSLQSAMARVQARALALLPQTLASGRHAPAAGLLLAFLRLYATVQGRVNTFADRHIDFYYRQCLGLHERPAAPDCVVVACGIAPHAQLPVLISAGTVFSAGKTAEGRPIEFRARESLRFGDARVARVATLRLERDPLISPEADLGYVTRARAGRLPIPAAPDVAWPPFGGGDSAGSGGADAALGLVLASPVLLLGEGTRDVEVTLRLAWPEGVRRQRVQHAVGARSAAQFRSAFGRLFSHWLLCAGQPLAADDRAALQTRARSLKMEPPDAVPPRRTAAAGSGPTRAGAAASRARSADASDPLQLLWDDIEPDRELLLDRLLRDTLEVHYTAAAGWLPAAHQLIERAPGGGLRIVTHLHPGDAAIVGCQPAVHGSHWPTRLPLMRVQTTGRGRMFPYSLFEGAALVRAEVKVRAQGVRNVLLHNNLGRLDASKAFNPFGPLPTLSSYLVFGAAEAAAKNLDRMVVHLDWGGLPRDLDGFDTYYAGYGPEQVNGAHRVALAILGGGQWHACGGSSDLAPLFGGLDAERRLLTRSRIEIDPGAVRTWTRASQAPLEYGLAARDGFFRIQLGAPAGAFGHQVYPQILAAAVTPPRWGTRSAGPLPNPPYTPLIEGLALDYEAHTTIGVAREPATADAERLLHQHPFGVAEVVAAATGPETGLLPHIEHDGNLYLGLEASALEGPLTLLFDLLDEGGDSAPMVDPEDPDDEQQRAPGSAHVGWAAMHAGGWRALAPGQVLSDTTSGFLTTGIVTLDLPSALVRNATVLDPGLFWLRAAADRGLDTVARLRGVHAHALTLERIADPAAALLPLAPGRVSGPRAPIAGLAAVTQVGPSFGLRAAEDLRQLRARAGERLRHKNRASLAWDTERLVLEQFPEVFKVKCLTPEESGLGVGRMLVVVVPALRPQVPADHARAPQLSPVTLARLRDFLAARVSACAEVRVRNVAYERVQVRCTLVLQRASAAGRVLQRVDEAILEYLSPWRDPEQGPSFDWTLRCDDVTDRLRQVEGVDEVSALALLGVGRSDRGLYRLQDSARPGAGEPGELRAQSRWSIALPMTHHLVATVQSQPDPRAHPAGVGAFEIATTFVVGRSAR